MTNEGFARWFFHPIVIDDEGWRVVDITNALVDALTTSEISAESMHVTCLGTGCAGDKTEANP